MAIAIIYHHAVKQITQPFWCVSIGVNINDLLKTSIPAINRFNQEFYRKSPFNVQ